MMNSKTANMPKAYMSYRRFVPLHMYIRTCSFITGVSTERSNFLLNAYGFLLPVLELISNTW